MGSKLNWLSAAELIAGYRKCAFSPVEVVRACLEQIDRHDASINAMCLIDGERSLDQARESERRWAEGAPKGLLDGVPVLIKDIILVKGWPTRRGSKTIDPDQPWDHDAPATARLKEHGAVLIGLTTTPEFGWKGVTDSPLTGITRNPWDLSKTPGGSSGGSAAALAAGYAPLAIGTDGGGSIRIPAGFTGTFGLKPSFGRVPAWPLSPFGTVAHVGPMARTVEDAALMLDVIAKPDPRDWHSLPHERIEYAGDLPARLDGVKVAYSPTLGYATVDPEIARLVEAAVETLSDLGAKVERVDPGFDDPAPCFRTLWWTGARSLLGNLPREKKALLDPDLADVVDQAMKLTLDDYLDAVKARGALGSHMRQFMEKYDLLVTPALPIAAFEAGKLAPGHEGTGKWVNWTPFTYPFNLTQQPAASVPCGFTAERLPAGLQIVGRMFDDRAVLAACHAYEQASRWNAQIAPFA